MLCTMICSIHLMIISFALVVDKNGGESRKTRFHLRRDEMELKRRRMHM